MQLICHAAPFWQLLYFWPRRGLLRICQAAIRDWLTLCKSALKADLNLILGFLSTRQKLIEGREYCIKLPTLG